MRVNIQLERERYCDEHCKNFYRCAVHWGADCTRMGGKKIPRMKHYPRDFARERETEPLEQENRRENKSRVKSFLEAVKTRVVGW